MRKKTQKNNFEESFPKESFRTLFDPNAPPKKIVLPSQSNRTESNQKLDQSGTAKVHETSSSNAKLANLKETYSRICKYENYWVSHPNSLDFKKRLDCCDLYSEIILTDYKLAVKYDLDSRQWKNVVYNIFNNFRSEFNSMENDKLKDWNEFLDLAGKAFADLANRLEVKKSKIPVWVSPLSHLGDICRYQAQYLSGSNSITAEEKWKSAQDWYNQALQISPANGLLWNQLGIVARARSYYLAAILYYMKALCVRNPFPSSKDALLELYHFFTNGFDENECHSSLTLENVEVEQIRNVETCFIKLQSALYTKVGLDGFQKLQARFSNSLLVAKPHLSMLTESQQLKWWFHLSLIMICNFSLIGRNSSFDENVKTILLGYAMESLVHVLNTISSVNWNAEEQNIFICTILLWISCNSDISEDLIKIFHGCWFNLIALYNRWTPPSFDKSIDVPLNDIMQKSSGLPEDSSFVCFAPFKNIQSSLLPEYEEQIWDSSSSLKRKARMILLMNFITKRTDSLPLDPKIIENDQHQKSYIFEEFDADEDEKDKVNVSTSESEERPLLKKVDELVEDIEISEDIMELKARVQLLTTKVILDPYTTVVVFDTNCFMHDFDNVKKILESKVWKIIIPLAVITELEGLSQDSSVGNRAANSLLYLKQNVSNAFQLQTLRGTIMSTMSFLSEDWGSFPTTDDVILEVCKFHKNVCLITNDINMRLKARTMNVPVLDSVKKLLQLNHGFI